MGEPEVREGADVFLHLENSVSVFRIQARRLVMMVRRLEIQVNPNFPQAEMQEMFTSVQPAAYRAEQSRAEQSRAEQSRAEGHFRESFQGRTGRETLHARKTPLQTGPTLISDGASPLKTPWLQFWVNTETFSSWPAFPSGANGSFQVHFIFHPTAKIRFGELAFFVELSQNNTVHNSPNCVPLLDLPLTTSIVCCLLYLTLFYSPPIQFTLFSFVLFYSFYNCAALNSLLRKFPKDRKSTRLNSSH